MTHYLIELATYCLVLYFLGCVLGAFFKRWFHANERIVAPVYVPFEETVPAFTPPNAIAVDGNTEGSMDVIKSSVKRRNSPTDPGRDVVSPLAARATLANVEESSSRPAGLTKPRKGRADDLLRIKGVGPKYAKLLNNLGYFHYDQIAEWTPDQAAWVDNQLGFDGRIDREDWVNQCMLLRDGKDAEFNRLYGSSSVAESRPRGLDKARGGKPDDLKRISGIGPKNEKVLHNLGVFHFDQIAAWTEQQIDWVDDHLNFNGRIAREAWVHQASLLADGKEDEFLKQYGTGGVKDSKGETQSGSRTKKS
jgi:predicted flap endonuclease-1-like 5' DNA nuclease